MQPGFQQQWEHCVPLQADIENPHINLTFRRVVMSYQDDMNPIVLNAAASPS